MPPRLPSHPVSRTHAMGRRRALTALAALPVLAASPLSAQAQAWPSRPVRIVVGFPPGASLDIMARLLAAEFATRTGGTFVVENRGGAGGIVAAEHVARSPADGTVIGVNGVAIVAIHQFLRARLPYDPDRDFAHASMTWEFPNVVVVPTEHVPARSIAAFGDYARAKPGGPTYGSSGIGTTPHLAGALLLERLGARGVHVPFRGSPEVLPRLLAGDVDMVVDTLAGSLALIREGRLTALAVTGPTRWPDLPDVPTMAEAGIPDFVVTSWTSFAFPAGTPAPMVERLSAVIRDIAADPALTARARLMGAQLLGSTPQQVNDRITRERPMWAEMVRISGARVD